MDRSSAFTSRQYDEAYPPGVERSFWHLARSAIIARQLNAAGLGGERLVEIGCGRGIVVEELRRRGFDCVGCELGEPEVEPRLREVVLTGTDFRRLDPARRQSTSGVLLLDVIEHLERPAELLAQVREAFPRLAMLLVTVPARQELWSNYDEHYGHFRRYTRGSLARELEGAGYQPLSLGYFFHALYAPAWVSRRGGRATTVQAPRLPVLHQLMAKAFMLEARLTPRWVPGTSLIALARPHPELRSPPWVGQTRADHA